MYSMCCIHQKDIARYFCTAMTNLCIPIYTQEVEDVSLPYMYIGFEAMKPVFRGKGCYSLECVLFTSQYSEAFVLNVNHVFYNLAQSLVCLEHHTELHKWKSENILRFIKHTIKETKHHTTVTWGAEVSTQWISS